MKFGFFLMPAHAPRENPTLAYERDLRLIEYAESLGFDEFWVGEHHTGGWEIIPAPDIFMSAAAQRTKRIRLGAGVVNLPYHHPFDVAERMAFLDQLTYGRVMLGVGPGVLPTDIKLYGLDQPKVRPMMDESLEIILRLFREDSPVTYEGAYWTIKDMELQVKCYQEPHLPIAVASTGSRCSRPTFRPALRGLLWANNGRSWKVWPRTGGPSSGAMTGASPTISTSPIPRNRPSPISRRARSGSCASISFPWASSPAMRSTQGSRRRRSTCGRRFEKGWIIGDPDDCIRALQDQVAGSGGFGGMLITSTEWTSQENWNHCLELFARYVMPEFQRSNRGTRSSWQRMVDASETGSLATPYGPGQRIE